MDGEGCTACKKGSIKDGACLVCAVATKSQEAQPIVEKKAVLKAKK